MLSHNEGISDLFESVHPDSTVVDAATACEQLLTGVGTELYLNGDQFASLQEVQGVNATAASTDPLLPRLLEATLQSFTRSGVDKVRALASLRFLPRKCRCTGDSSGRLTCIASMQQEEGGRGKGGGERGERGK